MTTTPRTREKGPSSFAEFEDVERSPGILERLLARDRPTLRELPLVTALLSVVGALLYGGHVLHGGLYSDDWAFASVTEHGGGLADEYRELRGSVGFRPLGVLSLVVRFNLFGEHTRWHLAAVLASTILLCAALYLFLRSVGLEKLHAGAISLLALACPYADATRLWATGSGANLAITFWLVGVVVALRGLTARTRRSAVLLHAGAVALYLASLMQYEVAYAAICASGLLYLTRTGVSRAGLLLAFPRAAVDVLAASLTVAVIVSRSEVNRTDSFAHHARLMFDGGVQILTRVVVPFDDPRPALILGALAAVFGAALVAVARRRHGEATRGELLRWLAVGGAGLIAAVAGYSMFAGAFDYYQPLNPGLADRTNAIASLGFIATAYAAFMCLATLAVRPLGASRGVAAGVTIVVAAVVFTGYQDRLRESAATWDDTWNREKAILTTLQTKLPDPPPSSTIYTFGHPVVSTNPGLPIFVSYWELRGAVQTVYDDPTLAAYPALPGTSLACTATRAYLQGGGYPKAYGDIYGQVYLVDVPRQRVERPDTRAQCLRDAARFHPGPLQPG
jgi:hypothetical protein